MKTNELDYCEKCKLQYLTLSYDAKYCQKCGGLLTIEKATMSNYSRTEQVAKEIIAYTQMNIGKTQDCIDFALESINAHFVEKVKQ